MTYEDDLARWAAGPTQVGARDGDIARAVLLDCLAVMGTGSRARASTALMQAPNATPQGDCAVVGAGQSRSPAAAALLNGTAGAAELWDDTSLWMNAHASVPIFAALLSAAVPLGRTLGDLIESYVVGMEVQMAVRTLAGPSLYLRGYHSTGLLGPLGAAAAVARLRGYSAEQMARTIGIAASMGSGLRVQFGSDVMPLHSGLAAERGLAAADLAAAGLTPDSVALTGRYGFSECHSDAPEQLGTWEGPLGLDAAEIVLKQYPVGAPNMAPVDAALRVRDAFGGDLDLRRIRSIHCKADRWIEYTIGLGVPPAPYAGRVNLPFCVIAALLHGDALHSAFLGDEPIPHEIRRLIEGFVVEVGDFRDDAGQASAEVAVITDVGRQSAWSSASAYLAPTLKGADGAAISRKAQAVRSFRGPAEDVVNLVARGPASTELADLLMLL